MYTLHVYFYLSMIILDYKVEPAASDPALLPLAIGRGELLAELCWRDLDCRTAVDGRCWRHLDIAIRRHVAVVAWPRVAQGALTEVHMQLHDRPRTAHDVAAVAVAVAAAALARALRPHAVHIDLLAVEHLVPDLAFG